VWRKIERIQPLLLNKEEARILTSISNSLSMLQIEVDREIVTQREI
jgi:pantothenate kinase